MYAAGVPTPVWAFLSAVGGIVVKGVFDLWQNRLTAEAEKRKTSGTVETSDAKVVFDAQQAALVMSESMRHDLRDQVERCQGQIQDLKDENDKLDEQMKTQAIDNAQHLENYRKRVEALEEELFDMSERLRREELK